MRRAHDERVTSPAAARPILIEALAAGDLSWGMWSLRACRDVHRRDVH